MAGRDSIELRSLLPAHHGAERGALPPASAARNVLPPQALPPRPSYVATAAKAVTAVANNATAAFRPDANDRRWFDYGHPRVGRHLSAFAGATVTVGFGYASYASSQHGVIGGAAFTGTAAALAGIVTAVHVGTQHIGPYVRRRGRPRQA